MSPDPSFDPRVAPREALLALPHSNTKSIDETLIERLTNGGTLSNQGVSIGAGIIDPTLSLNGHAFSIKVSLSHRETKMDKEVTVRLTGDPASPYLVLALAVSG